MQSPSLESILELKVQDHSDPIACIADDGRLYRYSELLGILRRAHQSAHSMNLVPGRRIAALLPHHITSAILVMSFCERASVLPLNPALAMVELSAICSSSKVETIICAAETMALACELAARNNIALLSVDLESGRLSRLKDGASAPSSDWDPALVLFTSGSTGEPKRVPLSSAMLMHSARTISRTLRLEPADRAGHMLPMFHIGALVDLVLAPLLSGGSIALSSEISADAICRLIEARDVTWLQLVPTMLFHVVQNLGPERLAASSRQLRFIRSVSSDLSPERQAAAEALFGVPIIQMYGMTEAAGQIASNPLPPGLRKPGTVGPPDGAEVAILDRTGSLLPAGKEGEICIRGASVTRGYEDTDPQAHFHLDWLRTGDLGHLDADGYLTLTGRSKDMINRGGEKISPVKIERAALSIEGVKEAAAYGEPHPTLGEVVGLAIVPEDRAKLTDQALTDALASRLAEFKRPRQVLILPELPRLGSGKLDRRRLRAATSSEQSKVILRGRVAQIVAQAWQEILQCDAPQLDDDFFDLGGDSLSGTQLVLELERRLGRRLSGNILFEAPRFGELVARLEAPAQIAQPQNRIRDHIRRNSAAWPGTPHRPDAFMLGLGTIGSKPPLFFGAQASGEAQAIRDVIAPDRPLYVMRTLYGLLPRSLDDKRELAAIYAREIGAIQPDGAVFLGGFCEGAEVAGMIAELLLSEGRQIGLLASIDHWFTAPTRYPVLHLWTASPRYSPGAMFFAPERALPLLHPAGFRIIQVAGDHTSAMNRQYLAEAGRLLEKLLDGTDRLDVVPSHGLIPLVDRSAMYSANLVSKLPLVLTEGKQRVLEVEITNTSQRDWPDPQTGGPVLTARFIPRSAGRLPVGGFGPLPLALKQGQRICIRLPIRAPAAGWMRLEVGMTDDGLSDFGPRLTRKVWVRKKRG